LLEDYIFTCRTDLAKKPMLHPYPKNDTESIKTVGRSQILFCYLSGLYFNRHIVLKISPDPSFLPSREKIAQEG
jgi:hypothetical protein